MLISVFGSLPRHFLSGFGVTFVGLVPSSFLGARVSGYCCNVCVCRYMCSEFYLSSVWGVLISFWSVLVFSLAFFRQFFSGTICLSSFAFPGDFLVFFLGRIRGILLSPTLLQIRVCWPVRLWFFQDFQYAFYASYALQLVGGLASGSSIFWGFSGRFSSCFGPVRLRLQMRWQ